jgi:hypothetical protein
MVPVILAAVVAFVVLFGMKSLRKIWRVSNAHVDTLPRERHDWPAPTQIGDRVMWCPIFARKVVVADTQIEEGEVGTVVGFTDDPRWPIISFDGRSGYDVTDKWIAARAIPVEIARPASTLDASARRAEAKRKHQRQQQRRKNRR